MVDHHKTAREELVDLPTNVEVKFDMNKSGATMSWEFFHNEEPPKLLQYIEDRDIWKWTMEESREFSEGLSAALEDNNLEDFDRLFKEGEEGIERMKYEGRILLKAKNNKLDALVNKISKYTEDYLADINGKTMIVVNFADPVDVSDLGNKIVKTTGYPAAMYYIENREGKLSFRSDEKAGPIDHIARSLGGGGHPMASGASVSVDKIFELVKTGKLYPEKEIRSIIVNDEEENTTKPGTDIKG